MRYGIHIAFLLNLGKREEFVTDHKLRQTSASFIAYLFVHWLLLPPTPPTVTLTH